MDCETLIPEKRLLAKPDAKYCVRCQVRHDDPIVAVRRHCGRLDELDVTDFERLPRSMARANAILEMPDADVIPDLFASMES